MRVLGNWVGLQESNYPEGMKMENEQTITLLFRKDGRRECTKLKYHSLAEVREAAEHVLRMGHDLYTEVAIWMDNGHLQTVQTQEIVAAPTYRVCSLRIQ